jgi:hypothetical protein
MPNQIGSADAGSQIQLNTNQFTRNNYFFAGWSTDPYANFNPQVGQYFTDAALVTLSGNSEIGLYAIWVTSDSLQLIHELNLGNPSTDLEGDADVTQNLPTFNAALGQIAYYTNLYNTYIAQANSATDAITKAQYTSAAYYSLKSAIYTDQNIIAFNTTSAQPIDPMNTSNNIIGQLQNVQTAITTSLSRKANINVTAVNPASNIYFTNSSYQTQKPTDVTYYLNPVAVQNFGLQVQVNWLAIPGTVYYQVQMVDSKNKSYVSATFGLQTNVVASYPGSASITVTAFGAGGSVIASQATTINVVGPLKTIPNLVGLSYSSAYGTLNSIGLSVTTSTTTSTDTKYQSYNTNGGYVFSQDPVPGQYYGLNSVSLSLIIYAQQTTTVPNIVGLTVSNAQVALANASLTLGAGTIVTTTNQSIDNQVITQSVPSGTNVVGGSAINYSYYVYQAASVSPVGVAPVGVSPVGVSPVGVSPVGVSPVGVSPVGVSPVGVSPAPSTTPYVALGYTDTGNEIQLQWSNAGQAPITATSFYGTLAGYVDTVSAGPTGGTAFLHSPYGVSGTIGVIVQTDYGVATSNLVSYTNYHGSPPGGGGVTPVGVSPVGVSPVGVSPVGVSPVGVSPVGVSPVFPVSTFPGGVPVSPVGVSPVGVSPVGVSPVGVSPVFPVSTFPGSVPVSPVGVSPVGVIPVGGVVPVFPVGGVSPVGVSPVGVIPVGGVSPVGVVPVGGGGGCLVYDTKVSLANGDFINIQDLTVGQKVKSAVIPNYPNGENIVLWYPASAWSLDEPFNTTIEETTVTNVRHIVEDHYYLINDRIKVTKEHFIFAGVDKVWQFVQAKDIKVGNFIFGLDNEQEEIVSVEKFNKMVMVVDIDVEPNDLFYAENIVVHNAKAI